MVTELSILGVGNGVEIKQIVNPVKFSSIFSSFEVPLLSIGLQ